MSLNIKNAETERLTHEVARRTGESLTTAITVALRERLERLGPGPRAGMAERLLAIGRETAARLPEPNRSIDHGDLLYDEKGLPK